MFANSKRRTKVVFGNGMSRKMLKWSRQLKIMKNQMISLKKRLGSQGKKKQGKNREGRGAINQEQENK